MTFYLINFSCRNYFYNKYVNKYLNCCINFRSDHDESKLTDFLDASMSSGTVQDGTVASSSQQMQQVRKSVHKIVCRNV